MRVSFFADPPTMGNALDMPNFHHRMHSSIAVVGVGNFLLGDDGVGVRAVPFLRARLDDSRVAVVDGGTIGFGLLSYLKGATHVLFVGAVDAAGLPPGALVERDLGAALPVGGAPVSPLDPGIGSLVRLLHAARGARAPVMRLVGVIPASVAISNELSRPVADALPRLAARAESIVHGWLEGVESPLPAGVSSGGGMPPCASESPVK